VPGLTKRGIRAGKRSPILCCGVLRRLTVILVLAAAALVLAAPAAASALIGRNARSVELEVSRQGMALVTYRQGAQVRHILAWGAINDDVEFELDYSGGWGTFRKQVWRTFEDASRPYDGPRLPYLVAARKAPDGSYWALQAWQRMLPNHGHAPWKASQTAWELHLSHWRGELPRIEIWLDWIYRGRFHHLFGRYTYRGKPVFGYSNTPKGNPLDPYGRNIFVDTYDSAYGDGWRRENSFLTHRPKGNFCYGFYPRNSIYDGSARPAGNGARYRASAMGPGVTPVVTWRGRGLGSYDPGVDGAMNRLAKTIAGSDPRCQKD